MLSQQEEAAAFIMRKRRMEPVKKMPSAEFTIQWKEIARIGKRGKHVTCKYKLRHTANRECKPVRNVHFVVGHRVGSRPSIWPSEVGEAEGMFALALERFSSFHRLLPTPQRGA